MAIRILCTGDVHIGRQPRGLPEALDTRALGPAAAWEAFVRTAIENHVDAAALTGDVVDEANRFFEAYSVLQAGIERLVEAGIAVFAVAGNHDADVLARLAGQMPQVRLLGRGGQWEEAFLPGADGSPVARFIGWSFPGRRVAVDPLAGRALPARPLPTIGLLHCDADAAGSTYGPVTLAQLKAQPVDAWLLGHIHKPGVLWAARPLVLYPGSPQGLDPGERGPHGAWLITLEPGAEPQARLIPLAALRWQAVDVNLEGVADKAALDEAILTGIRGVHERLRADLGPARAVGCRLQLSGRTKLHRHLDALTQDAADDLRFVQDGVDYFLETIEDHSRADIPLEDVARASDPAGLLARRLLLLERRSPEEAYRQLLRQGRAAIERAGGEAAFAGLDDDAALTDQHVEQQLVRAGLWLLEELLAQKEPAP